MSSWLQSDEAVLIMGVEEANRDRLIIIIDEGDDDVGGDGDDNVGGDGDDDDGDDDDGDDDNDNDDD